MNIEYIERELNQRKQQGLIRKLVVHPDGVDFASNDYLGIAKQSFKTTSLSGSAASRLISGNSSQVEALEDKIARFHQADQTLLFSSGYLANLGLCSSLGKRGVTFIFDEQVHASIRDGIRMSHAQTLKFKHNDLKSLADKLSQVATGIKFVVVEALYSMQGDFADLINIKNLCEQHSAHLIVDEAHSVGVYGESGRGLCNQLGIENAVYARIVTYGKAYGCQGAAVLCNMQLKEFLINFCRPFIYTTAMSPCILELIEANYEVVSNADLQRKKLLDLLEYFDQAAQKLKLNFQSLHSAIKFFVVSNNERARRLCSTLSNSGYLACPILSPTVKVGSEGLRIVLHCYNSRSEVDQLLSLIKDFCCLPESELK